MRSALRSSSRSPRKSSRCFSELPELGQIIDWPMGLMIHEQIIVDHLRVVLYHLKTRMPELRLEMQHITSRAQIKNYERPTESVSCDVDSGAG